MFALISVDSVPILPQMALSLLLEGDQSAKSHCWFTANIMGVYDLTIDSVRCLKFKW